MAKKKKEKKKKRAGFLSLTVKRFGAPHVGVSRF